MTTTTVVLQGGVERAPVLGGRPRGTTRSMSARERYSRYQAVQSIPQYHVMERKMKQENNPCRSGRVCCHGIDPSSSQDIVMFGSVAVAATAAFIGGFEKESEVCERCQGSGGVKCFACEGTGKFSSTTAGGDEVRRETSGSSGRDLLGRNRNPRECRACKGVGMLLCSACNGTGYTTKNKK